MRQIGIKGRIETVIAEEESEQNQSGKEPGLCIVESSCVPFGSKRPFGSSGQLTDDLQATMPT